jgi:hypothetical protein
LDRACDGVDDLTGEFVALGNRGTNGFVTVLVSTHSLGGGS